jgi:hypothetical protein
MATLIHREIWEKRMTRNLRLDQTTERIKIIIPADLSEEWKIIVYGAFGYPVDKEELMGVNFITDTRSFQNMQGAKIANGRYLLIAQYTETKGQTKLFKKIISVIFFFLTL